MKKSLLGLFLLLLHFTGFGQPSNSDPEHIVPVEEQIKISRSTCKLELDPYSLTILKIQLN